LDTALKILKEQGLPTLIALGLGYLLWQASEERVNHTVLLIDQLSDLREKVALIEGLCGKR
jgi:hypothetical protein